jgi:hypothetical protein
MVKGQRIVGRQGSEVTMHPRWTRFGLAALATVILATSVGVAVELLAGRSPDTTLRLKSVSAAQLDQLGIKLVATSPPPYCALSDAVDDHGWARSGLGGCPISRKVAEKAARTGVNLTVVESALARATMPQNDSVGQDHLVWVVVVQSSRPHVVPAIACPVPAGGGASWACPRTVGASRVLLLDGRTGALLYGSWGGGSGIGPMVPRPVPAGRLPTLPINS